MPNSLVKFANRLDGDGRGKLYWGRADRDGLPFRGPTAPTFTEEEYEERVVKVADPHNGTFHTWDQKENSAYLDILDKILNGWATLIFQDTWKERVKVGGRVQRRAVHYIVWAEFFMEDGARTTASYGQPVEFSHGQAVGPQHHFSGS